MEKRIQKNLVRLWVNILGLVAGLVCLGLLLAKLDLGLTLKTLGQIRWGILLVFALTLPKFWIYACSWRLILTQLGESVSTGTLFRLKLIGEAINEATPLNFLGGDTLRVGLLKSHLSLKTGVQSVVVDRISHMVSGAIIMLIGGLLFVAHARALSWSTWGITAKGVLCVVVLLVIGSFSVKWLRPKIPPEVRQMKGTFLQTVMLTLLGRSFSILEIYLIAWLIHASVSFSDAVILNGLSLGLGTLFAFVPGTVGILEGGFVGYFSWLGRSLEGGMALSFIRRLNGIFWILVGLLTLLATRAEES